MPRVRITRYESPPSGAPIMTMNGSNGSYISGKRRRRSGGSFSGTISPQITRGCATPTARSYLRFVGSRRQ